MPDPKPLILSPSQIETFDPNTPFGCNRKWWFKYVAKLTAPQDAALAFGSATHKNIEDYLANPETVLAPHVEPGRNILDDYRGRIELIEHSIAPGEVLIDGTPVIGRIDAVADNLTDPVEVIDWKTTSNIKKYAKTAEGVKKSIQMTIYDKAILSMKKWQNEEFVQNTQVFFQSKGAYKAKKISGPAALSSREEVDNRILEIKSLVTEIKDVAKLDKIESVTPDLSKCHIGYGCPYRDQCPRGSAGGFTVDLLSAFRASAPVPAAAAPAAAPAVSAAPAVDTAPPPIRVLPPDAPASTPALAADPVVPKTRRLNLVDVASTEEKAPAAPAETVAPSSGTQTSAPPAESPAEPVKRGRGRPKGSTNKPKDVEAAPVVAAAPVESTAAPEVLRINVGAPIGVEGRPAAVRVKRIIIRHALTLNMGNYQNAKVDVELEGEVDGSLTNAASDLSVAVRTQLAKELEPYERGVAEAMVKHPEWFKK